MVSYLKHIQQIVLGLSAATWTHSAYAYREKELL